MIGQLRISMVWAWIHSTFDLFDHFQCFMLSFVYEFKATRIKPEFKIYKKESLWLLKALRKCIHIPPWLKTSAWGVSVEFKKVVFKRVCFCGKESFLRWNFLLCALRRLSDYEIWGDRLLKFSRKRLLSTIVLKTRNFIFTGIQKRKGTQERYCIPDMYLS